MTPTRRDLLAFAGGAATVATVGTVGATAIAGQETADDDLPAYSRWLTIDDDGLEFVYADWATVGEFVLDDLRDESPDDVDVPAEYDADPMIVAPSEGLLWAYFFVGLDLGQYRLGRLLDDDDAFESTVEELILVNEAFVVTGQIVPDEIDDRLTAEPEAEFFTQFERTDEIDSFDIYTPIEGDVDAAIAVNSDALVVVDGEELAPDEGPIQVLERTIRAAAGDVDRAANEAATVETVLGIAGGGDLTVGQYGDRVSDGVVDFGFEELEDAEAIVSSLSVVDAETSAGEFAAIGDDPDEAALAALLGAAGDDQSVTVDGDLVTATATYREQGAAVD